MTAATFHTLLDFMYTGRTSLLRSTTLILTFDLIFTGGQGILCAKFGDFSFSRFGFIVRADHTQTESRRESRTAEADQRYTHIQGAAKKRTTTKI